MPRPKKQSEEARRRVVKFLLTDAEHAALQAQSAQAGVEVNEYARMKATGAGRQRRAGQRPEPPGAYELRQQLVRVGVNMNQIARSLNMTGEHEPAELREASQHLTELFRRMLAEVSFR